MLELISFDQNEKWNKTIEKFDNQDIYYSRNYVDAFRVHGDGIPMLFYYHDENIRAINLVMKRDIADDPRFSDIISKRKYFDISTPYGYGGFLIEGEINQVSITKLKEEYIEMCNNLNIISEFVRFHPVLKNSDYCKELYDVIQLGPTITMDLGDQENIWSNVTSKNRNMIRKAEKNNIEIENGFSWELLQKFIPMYNSTMDKDEAKDYYYFDEEFYKSIYNQLSDKCRIFYASLEREIISMAMILIGNKGIHYHLSASNPKFNRLAPSNLLLYKIACWGNEKGFQFFHLGGGVGSSEEDGLYKFKKSFSKNSDTFFSIGRKIFDEKRYSELVKNREGEIVSNFFPRYRG